MTNDELLADLRRVASQLGLSAVPQRSYRPLGQYSTSTFKKRFGSWNAAARAAGLRPTTEINLPDDELLRNLEEVWVSLGRQPRKKDMVRPASRFTREPYIRRYGGWVNAIREFLKAVEVEGVMGSISSNVAPGRGPRHPSLRLRFLVLRRDRFSCRNCGASPAKNPSVELNIDHVVPWSDGGATVTENLQTLCMQCNLGKTNLAAVAP